MATDEDVATGLIFWVNSLEVTEPFSTVDELASGHVLWKLLQLIDDISFPGSLPEDSSLVDRNSPQSWISMWTNLKHLYDALSIYLMENLELHLPIFYGANGQKTNPDLKAIAQHNSLPDLILLLKLCVVAAANCEQRIEFLQPMQHLRGDVQRVLMATLQEAGESAKESENDEKEHDHEAEDNEYQDDDEGIYSDEEEEQAQYPEEPLHAVPSHSRNKSLIPASDLAFEEKLSKVIADSARVSHEKRELQRHIDDLSARFDTLQERYDRSQDDLQEANDRLGAVLSGRAGGAEKSSESQKEAVIATLEARVTEYESDIGALRKANEVLKIKAERVQKVQDDYDEIKIERDNLARKANAADKYRLKLEATQDMEKENATLKQKIVDLQTQVRQSDTRTASSSDLQREIDEYRRLLPAIEQERHEVNEMKKRLEFDYHMLQARYTESEDQNRRSRQEIEDLQARLREHEDGVQSGPRRSTGFAEAENGEANDLETEEADFVAAEARLTEALLKSSENGTSANHSEPGTRGVTESLSENGISEDELRAIMSAMHAQMQAGAVQEREFGLKTQQKLVIMLEKVRSRNIVLADHITKQSELISNLQSQPAVPDHPTEDLSSKEPKTGSELEDQLEEQEQLIENLKREIRLISSAWFEQQQRLATLGSGSGGGAVALMRLKGGAGLEEPQSFLGKQRKMVDKVVLGGGVKMTRG